MSHSSSTTDPTPPRIDWKKRLEEHFAASERGHDSNLHALQAQVAATALLAEAVERAVSAQTMSGVLQGLGSFFAGSSLSEKLAKAMMVTKNDPPDSEADNYFGAPVATCKVCGENTHIGITHSCRAK